MAKNKIILGTVLALVISGGIFAHQTTRPDSTRQTDTQSDQSSTTTENSVADSQNVSPSDPEPADKIKDWQLITENEQYKIRYDGAKYLITLYAIINRPDQYDAYRDQLREYKQNALDYLRNTGVNVNTAKIEYEPEEASDL